MEKFITTALWLLLGFVGSLSGQQPEKYQVWLDSQEVDGKKIIVGWCINKSTSPVHFTYEAAVKLRGQKENLFRGTTLALPNFPTLLTKAVFTLDDKKIERIVLKLFNSEKQLLATHILQATNPTIAIRETAPQISVSPTPLKKEVQPGLLDLEIDGLVLDETRSKLARDFYETFHRNWSTLQINTEGQTIIVREMPTRIGIGSVVIVEVNDRTITQLNLQPRADLIEDLAGQLVELLEKYLSDPSNHTVIEGDDLIGSGIY